MVNWVKSGMELVWVGIDDNSELWNSPYFRARRIKIACAIRRHIAVSSRFDAEVSSAPGLKGVQQISLVGFRCTYSG
jgi:hypothetical protein